MIICLISRKNYAQSSFWNLKTELNKYAGIWQWSEKKDTFRLFLRADSLYKSQKIKDSSNTKLVLYGWHRYVEKGREIESDMDQSGNLKKFSVMGAIESANGTNNARLMFYDITRDKYFTVFFKILNKEQSMVYWESRPQERTGGSGLIPKTEGGQTVPSPLILVKVID